MINANTNDTVKPDVYHKSEKNKVVKFFRNVYRCTYRFMWDYVRNVYHTKFTFIITEQLEIKFY